MRSSSTVSPAARFARRESLFCVRQCAVLSLFLLCAMSPLVAGASSAQNQQQAGAAEVIIKNFRFQPAQLSVHPGESILFENEDIYAHTATADDGSFDSGLIQPGSSWKLTVAKAGTIAYHCTPHPNMKATLVATSGAGQQPAAGSEAGPSPRFNPPSSPKEFHPILVNFTAALLPLAFLSDLLGLWWKRAALHNAAAWILAYAAIITPFSAAAGWWWKCKSAGALPASVIVVHQWLGTSLAVIFILLAIWRWRPQYRNAAPSVVYLVITAIVALALIYQGSLGGLMVFGR